MHTCVPVGVQPLPPPPPPYVGELLPQPSNAEKAPMTRMTRVRMERLPPGAKPSTDTRYTRSGGGWFRQARSADGGRRLWNAFCFSAPQLRRTPLGGVGLIMSAVQLPAIFAFAASASSI